RLVADDTVEIRKRAETILIGTCPELTRHHMEIRGLGVINIQDLFGIASTRSSNILVEIAARNQLLRARGHHAAKKLADKLEHQLQLAGLEDIDESEIDDLPDTGEDR